MAGLGRRAVLGAAVGGAVGVTGAVAAPALPAAAGLPGWGRVRTGAEVAAAANWSMFAGQKLGVISNPTGVLPDYSHIVDSMVTNKKLTIAGVFGPEHGFRGSAQAGGSEGTGTDARTGLTVYDAYGANINKFKTLFDKAGVETVIFDIQDVGARFYTYIWTLYNSMAAAAATGRKYVVLDRPNPVGGEADGPLMRPGFTSGVGLKQIVQRHGMTVGELARFYDGEFLQAEVGAKLGKNLSVIRCTGWRANMLATETGVPWVPPSPNMPTQQTAQVYVGTCYFEAVPLSEGRGTTRPFEFIGSPDLDYKFGDRLNARKLPGVRFREAYFVPSFEDQAGKTCAGVEVTVTDPHRFRAIETAVAMLIEARKYPNFSWVHSGSQYWLDLLSGSDRLRSQIDAGAEVAEIVASWKPEVAAFNRQRAPYLLYGGRSR
ncbi:exo-beta-N-acetylmuramidase NamZ family protein [Fodinicola acaciae]|uniref:exo-beta-N-acetylmuramidase NamZ family protein n=1 Tax=Fodinicola acaciae TaxID=2681555 RepID=UPI0013D85DF9|nr:DUF1343 domain-containing protein [Fodinicola acaciae]